MLAATQSTAIESQQKIRTLVLLAEAVAITATALDQSGQSQKGTARRGQEEKQGGFGSRTWSRQGSRSLSTFWLPWHAGYLGVRREPRVRSGDNPGRP